MVKHRTPKTLLEAVRYFADPDLCREFVAEMRWPNGVACPRKGCGSTNVHFISTRKIWCCNGCKKQFSVKVGTIFEDSPVGLDKWLSAIWMITADKKGVSSYQLARALGVTQKTAWFMLYRIRLAMKPDSSNTPLSGEVEADESSVGGKERNKHATRCRGTVPTLANAQCRRRYMSMLRPVLLSTRMPWHDTLALRRLIFMRY